MITLWRTRQFEYTWLRTVGRQYADFWQVTEEVLVFSCKSLKLELTGGDSERRMQSYTNLKAWAGCTRGAILYAAGSSFDKIVTVTIILAERDDFAGMNEESLRWFPAHIARQGTKLTV